MQLFHASNQWATRPDDERFQTLEAMRDACYRYAAHAQEAEVPFSDLRVEAQGEEIGLIGRAGVPARLTHHAFGQLASRVQAPAAYLRSLPATLAAQNLNYGLARKSDGPNDARLLFHSNGGLLLRAATTTMYNRLWNYELVDRLIDMSARYNMEAAHQTFSWGGGAVPADAERSLYASDHDMFAFLMSPERTIMGPDGKPLRRGFIAINSEVGDKALKFMGFLFRDVCANHIIWGAEQLAEVNYAHVGDINGKLGEAVVTLRKYMDGAASIDEARFEELRVQVADTKAEVVDKLFRMSLGITKSALDESYDAVVPDEDGDPRSAWGMVQGITRRSQLTPYADERTALDRAAGKLMAKQIAF
jgi:hypothetical protein